MFRNMDAKATTSEVRTPMDALTAIAAFLLPSPILRSPEYYSHLLLSLPGGAARLLYALRRVLLFLSRLFFLFLSLLFPQSPTPPATPYLAAAELPQLDVASGVGGTWKNAVRALSHVLSVGLGLPVASRKYELVRSLAERLLDDNLLFGGGRLGYLNLAALADAFSLTLRHLDAAVGARDWPAVDMAVRTVRSMISRWWPVRAAAGEKVEVCGAAAEKLAAELLWLAKKMDECGGAGEAAARFGAASSLGRRALAAEPRLQEALVRVAVFLFKHANSKQFEECTGGEEEDSIIADQRMAMLKSWLPFLCRASNGTDTPVLSSKERAEMVMVLEQLIQKLSWKQQEEVLAIWLHHFAACPDSDWPNLESCYTRWFSETRKLLM